MGDLWACPNTGTMIDQAAKWLRCRSTLKELVFGTTVDAVRNLVKVPVLMVK